MKSFLSALTLIAAVSTSATLVEARNSSYNPDSRTAFKVLLANTHVRASDSQDPTAKPVRVSSLLANMLTVADESATYLAMSTHSCESESAEVVICTLLILSSDRNGDLSPAENMTESTTVIEYKVNLKTQKLVGKPTYSFAG